ncbi:YwiC-like family protein [Actinomyces sp. B33]|uniref:YwiC-like family protein n=1 Tax=Actinomyces sp. B33 TaxID=2942131 RepID=UPI002340600E|nr:YwiC-like family protein [Actinomyces sp. B33]MDC4232331.1 YwiC-like family protein [Actinomyces sp. B33]
MASPPSPTAPRTRHVRGLMRDGWLPDQHGAWPMTLAPLLVGALIGGPAPLHLLLAATWLCAFCCFNAVELWAKRPARRRRGLLPALAVWTALSLVGGLALVAARPSVLSWAPAFAPMTALALWEVLRRRERALITRATSILASCLMAPVAHGLGAAPGEGARIWAATAVLAAYFLGTVPVVRSLLRGRDDPRWAAGAIAWHAACGAGVVWACASGLVSWWAGAAWAVLLLRAAATPAIRRRRGSMAPAVIGAAEALWCVGIVATLVAPV